MVNPPDPDPAASSELVERAVTKFLPRVMPILVLMLVVNQMDRTNVGFVQDDLKADIGIGSAAYGLGAGLFDGQHQRRPLRALRGLAARHRRRVLPASRQRPERRRSRRPRPRPDRLRVTPARPPGTVCSGRDGPVEPQRRTAVAVSTRSSAGLGQRSPEAGVGTARVTWIFSRNISSSTRGAISCCHRSLS
ncbi:hypothetical protein SSPO_089070 [Streptomyces antimycoticus]|uniref:Major facilitator superfamily (MFS) profile domain-containing protein n=1 Tax=Streptomyces antimycoticus TaxID=68175 RepID=A0A499VB14_9ACTN|nr:hypothetical protein SSPO_089070 [Streptomyces antimycoticus]